MAWSFVGVGNSTSVSSGNITLVEPSGVAQGDLLVACIAYRSNATFTVPGDWNLVATQQSSGNTTTTVTSAIGSGLMMWCIRGASAPTLTITRTAGDVAMASVVAYRGHRASPYDTGSANTLGSVSNTVTTGTITTAEANALIVAMAAGADNITWSAFDAATDPATASGATDTSTAPTAGTWIERRDANSNLGGDTALGIADAIRATAGATGTIQATASGTNSRHVMIAAAFLPRDDVSPSGTTLTVTPVLIDGDVAIENPGTGADELKTEAGFFLLQEDGAYIQLDVTAVDANVGGQTLTVSPTLIDGDVAIDNPGTGANELLLETGTDFLLQEDGSYIQLEAAAGDVSVGGQTLSVAPTLIDGSVVGDANVTGQTVSVAPTLTDGAVTATAAVAGQTLTVSPTLVDGTVAANSNVAGQTLTVSPTLLDGSVTGNADVGGQTLTVTPTLTDGTVTAGGNVTIGGETLTVAPSLIDGSVAADANVSGEVLTLSPTLIDGTVSIEGDASVGGATLSVTVLLLDGVVSIVGSQTPSTKPPGGDDAPRSHVGIAPKRVKDKYEKRGIDREDIEEIYNRIHGIEPQTKAGKRAIAAVQKAVAPGASELPLTLDWVAIDNDLKAVIAIRKAWQVIRDEEDAVIALLLAA